MSALALRVADVSLVAFVFSSTVSITLEQASIVLAFLAWSTALVLGFRPDYRKGMIELAFLLLLASQLISSVFSLRMSESFFGVRDLFFICIVYLFATLTRTRRRLKEFVYLFLFSATLMSVYGLVESGMGVQRITATQSTPLTFSGILVIAFSIGFSFFVFGANRRKRIILGPQLAVIFAALLLSHTRSSWIGAFCAIVLIGMLRSKWLVLGLFLLAGGAYFMLPGSLGSRAKSIFNPYEPSNYMRIVLFRSSPRVIRDHPITGVGLVDLLPIYDKYVYPQVPENLRHERLGHFHNNLVQVTVQTGIFGLTIFVFLMFNIVRSEWDGYRAAGDRFLKCISLGNLAAFTGFFINGMFEYNFGDSEVIMLIWFTLGLSIACRRLSSCGSSSAG
ncbi:MAG: O-antigen ligase family protein [bacterium]